MVGAWGFEPQTPTVSTHRFTFRKSNNPAVSLGFSALPDRLPDQPAQLPAQFAEETDQKIGKQSDFEIIPSFKGPPLL
jgi:hypothetical protein